MISAAKARLPSGQNPLQQLVLIIGDGRFHEKELSFQGKQIKVSKYLDSFPFPYYIVLRNIEALPRTLADLLREWFELMQNTRE
ncbi:hypothetical protein Pint_29032 [Pistacia integerrima]|uniref:Uncharacterized protein n=1 Tax=Pistacia integerrima TaxID=434235 RepID=A0ACC0X4A8_9ROSI|nr:hypothetical protein Pint_29032 [Pistacia integerrima]